jgi:hypothetical protein
MPNSCKVPHWIWGGYLNQGKYTMQRQNLKIVHTEKKSMGKGWPRTHAIGQNPTGDRWILFSSSVRWLKLNSGSSAKLVYLPHGCWMVSTNVNTTCGKKKKTQKWNWEENPNGKRVTQTLSSWGPVVTSHISVVQSSGAPVHIPPSKYSTCRVAQCATLATWPHTWFSPANLRHKLLYLLR